MRLTGGGESLGGVLQASGRHLEAEEGLFMPEPDRASLHDSEGPILQPGVEDKDVACMRRKKGLK